MSRFEREERVPSVVLAPAERYVVEVRFDKPGRYALVNSIQAINHFAGEFEPRGRHARRRHRRATAGAPDYSRAVRDAARECGGDRRDIDRFRPYFDKPPDKTLTLTVPTNGAAARDGAVHERRHGVFRAGRVGGRHARHELALDQQAGALDPARRRDGQGEHGHRLARAARIGREAAHLQRSRSRFTRCSIRSISMGSECSWCRATACRRAISSWKDTALIPVGSTVDLLIDASNPGDWMLHCHIAEHLARG